MRGKGRDVELVVVLHFVVRRIVGHVGRIIGRILFGWLVVRIVVGRIVRDVVVRRVELGRGSSLWDSAGRRW